MESMADLLRDPREPLHPHPRLKKIMHRKLLKYPKKIRGLTFTLAPPHSVLSLVHSRSCIPTSSLGHSFLSTSLPSDDDGTLISHHDTAQLHNSIVCNLSLYMFVICFPFAVTRQLSSSFDSI